MYKYLRTVAGNSDSSEIETWRQAVKSGAFKSTKSTRPILSPTARGVCSKTALPRGIFPAPNRVRMILYLRRESPFCSLNASMLDHCIICSKGQSVVYDYG